jgi:hypothetical protein
MGLWEARYYWDICTQFTKLRDLAEVPRLPGQNGCTSTRGCAGGAERIPWAPEDAALFPLMFSAA